MATFTKSTMICKWPWSQHPSGGSWPRQSMATSAWYIIRYIQLGFFILCLNIQTYICDLYMNVYMIAWSSVWFHDAYTCIDLDILEPWPLPNQRIFFVICKYEYVFSPVGTWHQINQSPDTHRSKRNDGCWEASGSDPHPPKLIVNSGGEINRWYITFNHHCLDIWMVVTYYLDLYFKPFYVLGWSTKWFWTCVNQVSPYMNSEWSCAT